jgi:hypothetical protein
MMPALSVLQSVGCNGRNARCCDFAAEVVIAEIDNELKIISCDTNGISEPQVLVDNESMECNALALTHDGSILLAGDIDGCLKMIKLSEPKACTIITLPAGHGEDVHEPIECIVDDDKGKFAVAAGR